VQSRKEFFKKWLKNTALVGGGYAAGQGAGMLIEKGVKTIAGPSWNRWSNADSKSKILRGVATLAGVGAILAINEQEREKARRLK
jgi:hypothetical protein